MGVWQKQGDKYKQKCVKGTVKNRRRLMAWLVIAADGTSRFIHCPDRMDSGGYQSVVLTPNLSFLRAAVGSPGNSVIFQQNCAHASRSTTAYLKSKRIQVLPTWPAQSPEVNIMEHYWSWLAFQMVGKSFKTIDEIW